MRLERRTKGWLLVAIQALFLGLLVLGPPGSLWPVPGWLHTVGTILRVAGAVAIVGGVVKLGRGVSVHPEPAENAILRVDGPYRYVRHPIYTGVMVLAAGIAASSGSGWSLGALAGLLVLFLIKARFEEDLLTARFDGYQSYARSTPPFVPRFRRGHTT